MNEQVNKHINSIIYAILILLTSLVLFIGYEFLWPVEVLKPNVQPYKIVNKKVRPGDSLIYVVDACKFKNVSTTVVRRFVDHVVLNQEPEVSNIRVGCGQTNVSIMVPKLITPGIWHLDIDVSYKINPFRTKEYHLITEDFEVLPEVLP